MIESRFRNQRRIALNNYLASKRVGDVDAEIVSLLDFVNSLESHYSTSSCSGRIAVIDDSGSKEDSSLRGVWHEPVQADEVAGALDNPMGVIWMKYDAPIIHVASKTVDDASGFLAACRQAGFKRGGIQSAKEGRVMLEVFGTGKLEAPLMDSAGLMADGEYVEKLVEIANKYLLDGFATLTRLEDGLRSAYE